MTVKSFSFFLFLVLSTLKGFSQNKTRDSLAQLSYEALIKAFHENEDNFKLGNLIADVTLSKAKREKHTNNIARAYYRKAAVHAYRGTEEGNELGLIYCDSVIEYTKYRTFVGFPEDGYLMKGFIYERRNDMKKALNSFLKAYQYALKSNNSIMKNQALDNIAGIKYTSGDFTGAIKIYKELELIYSNKKYIDVYGKEQLMLAFNGLSNSYLHGKTPDSAFMYANFGIKETYGITDLKSYYYIFLTDTAEALHSLGDNDRALDSLNKFDKELKNEKLELPVLNDKTHHIMFGYYLKGKIYESKKVIDSTIKYYTKVDSSYQQNQKLFLGLDKVYKTLFNYYSKHGTPKEKLESVAKLIDIDSVLHTEYRNYDKQLIEGYERPKLENEKQQLIKTIARHKKQAKFKFTALIIGLVLLAGVAVFFYRRQYIYKLRYTALVNSTSHEVAEVETPKTTTISYLDISPDIIETVLKGLKQFEAQHEFLQNELTVNNLAKQLETNSSYLSKIIKHYKGDSYSNYIKKLRVNYAIKTLKTNNKLRNYTIKAIAELVGFNNAESFSKAFYKQAGIYPSFYIKQLNKKTILGE